jgi:hypothetical protein
MVKTVLEGTRMKNPYDLSRNRSGVVPACVQQADGEEEPCKAGAVAGEDVREVVNAEIEAAEPDDSDEEADARESGEARPRRMDTAREDVCQRSVDGDRAQCVAAREREPAGRRDGILEGGSRPLEDGLQDPGQELRAHQRHHEERGLAPASARGEVCRGRPHDEREHRRAAEERYGRERGGRRRDDVRVQRVRQLRVDLHDRISGRVGVGEKGERSHRLEERDDGKSGEAESLLHDTRR